MWLIVLYCVCLLVFSILCSACIVCIPWSISRTKQWEAKPLREQRAFPQLAHAIISQNFIFHSFFKTTSVTQSFNFHVDWIPTILRIRIHDWDHQHPPTKTLWNFAGKGNCDIRPPKKRKKTHRSLKASSKRWTVFIMRPSWEEGRNDWKKVGFIQNLNVWSVKRRTMGTFQRGLYCYCK